MDTGSSNAGGLKPGGRYSYTEDTTMLVSLF